MKKILITLLFVLSVLGVHRAQAEVSLSFFYDSLQDDGDWFEADDYGYCWQPRDVPEDWSPYTDGYWTYTDAGWTWVSYESFGWATYHYGRWADIRGRGWVWVPGYEWGPAWVSWRSNDDYIGWAPLPARAVVSIGVSIGRDVDYDYDIGPSYYRFTSCRRFGSPSLRGTYVDRSENVTIINQTTNITNITYQNNIVYNGGPDYDRVNRRSERPIERLQLERISRMDDRRDNRFARRENGRLAVVAPAVVPVEERIRPRNIKASLGKVETDRGWSGVRDARLAQRTREKIRDENKGRSRGPVNRNETVAQALRSEARQKPVASAPAHPANIRPVRRPEVNDRTAKPTNDRVLKSSDPAPHKPMNRRSDIAKPATENNSKPQTRENPLRRNPVAPVTRDAEPARTSKPDRSNNEDASRQREAAARRQQVAAAERENTLRKQQASRQREEGNSQREEQANRQREQANAARQQQAAEARQQAARRANQQDQVEAARIRAQRQQAQVQREQVQRREPTQAQPVRRESSPQPRQLRPQTRPQVQQSRERAPQPSKEERDPRKKKKSDDDGH